MKKNNAPDKNSPEALQKQFDAARNTLLMAVILTAVNMVMSVTEAGYYFLFSISVPYYMTVFFVGMQGMVIGLVILAVYLLCWAKSKKTGWMVAALVLFALDTLVLVGLAVLMGSLLAFLLDLVFHGAVLVTLIQGVIASKKLQNVEAPKLEAYIHVQDLSASQSSNNDY